MPIPVKIEYAGERRIRERNKKMYRGAHWPIWIWVVFLAPGPLTFDLFAIGPDPPRHGMAAAGDGGDGHSGDSRATTRGRAAALHPALHRRPAQPALPQNLLHVCVERRYHFRVAEPDG